MRGSLTTLLPDLHSGGALVALRGYEFHDMVKFRVDIGYTGVGNTAETDI